MAATRRSSNVIPLPSGRVPTPARGPSLPFDVDESKIRVPALKAGLVSRTPLVNRLRVETTSRLVTVTAPAGYGKTTLLAQWAGRDRRGFAWVSIDERDRDPLVLLRHVAAALHAIEPLDVHVLQALVRPESSLWSAALPRVANALASGPARVLVLDDLDVLRSLEALDVVSALADQLPDGGLLVVAGRTQPRLRVAALRAAGTLLELGADELALTPREAQRLLRHTGVELQFDELTRLVGECEGWPAAVHFAARNLRDGGDEAPEERVARGMASYLRAQYLSRLRPEVRQFLRRTAVVDELCGSLCDSLLGRDGSARELELIERSNLFLVPLDRHRVWYRYHRLFRQALRAELAATEPKLARELHRRAADWYVAHRDLESALRHAHAQGDRRRAARIFGRIALPLYRGGQAETVDRWLEAFDEPLVLRRYPTLALRGSWIHGVRGRRVDAERWLAVAEGGLRDHERRNASSDQRAWAATVRAALCRDGAARMAADAETALTLLPPHDPLRASTLLVSGVALMLLGRVGRADAILAEAAAEADRTTAFDTQALALAERAVLAAAQGDGASAEELALAAHALAHERNAAGYPTTALALVVAARPLLRQGRWDEARADLDQVRRLTPSLGRGLFPWLALQTRIELARAHLSLRETDVVRTLLAEIADLLGEWPQFGLLADEADALERGLRTAPAPDRRAAGLTPAELRLLPLLATHLSFREIGEQLYVSRNTIKTQAISVYRKLGVTSRSDAITSAAQLGLVKLAPPAATVHPARVMTEVANR